MTNRRPLPVPSHALLTALAERFPGVRFSRWELCDDTRDDGDGESGPHLVGGEYWTAQARDAQGELGTLYVDDGSMQVVDDYGNEVA